MDSIVWATVLWESACARAEWINLASSLQYLGRDAVRQAKAYADSYLDDDKATDSNKRESTQHFMDCL